MENKHFNEITERVLSYFPIRIREALNIFLGGCRGVLSEIRLCGDSQIFLRIDSVSVATDIMCTHEDMRYVMRGLCGNSMYSHAESLKDGYITTSDGIRAGIVGRAVTENGKISVVTDISSIVIRIPRRFPGAASELYALLEHMRWQGSVLVYSPPGGGKTTLLRELAAMLGTKENYKRTAVVDSRNEICSGLSGGNICSLFSYPRAKGMEVAVRCLSPDVIICDEISTSDDAAAAVECLGAGVILVASAHGTEEDIFNRRIVKELFPFGLFKAYYGVEKSRGTLRGKITYAKDIKI